MPKKVVWSSLIGFIFLCGILFLGDLPQRFFQTNLIECTPNKNLITDTHFQNALSIAIADNEGGAAPAWNLVTSEQLKNLQTVNAPSSSITNIDGVEELCNVSSLILRNNNLTTLPVSDLDDLVSLTTLDLHNNQITGTIPTTIENLSALTSLDLSDNSLSGAIPSELGNITGLMTLGLHNNNLSGIIPESLDRSYSALSVCNSVGENNNFSQAPYSFGQEANDTSCIAEIALGISISTVIPSRILIATQNDQDLLTIQISNGNTTQSQNLGALSFTDLINEGAADRLDFKLYDQSDTLLQIKQMVGDSLTFDTTGLNEINIPANSSIILKIKADIRSITNQNFTGKRIQLSLNQKPSINSGIFIMYRSAIEVRHADQQFFSGSSDVTPVEVYRFTVSADDIRQAAIRRVSFQATTQGLISNSFDAVTNDRDVIRVVESNGDINTEEVANATLVGDRLQIDFDPNLVGRLAQGESRTYAVFLATSAPSGQTTDDRVVFEPLDDIYTPASDLATKTNASFDCDTMTGGIQPCNIIWSDEADDLHSDATLDWHNGYLLETDESQSFAPIPGLNYNLSQTIDADILIGNSFNNKIFKFQVTNTADIAQNINQLTFSNDFTGNQVGDVIENFKLYQGTTLLQTQTMVGDTLNFDLLGNNQAITLNPDQTIELSIDTHIKTINQSSITGRRLQLSLHNTNLQTEIFPLYRSTFGFSHQGSFTGASDTTPLEVYRFTVTSDPLKSVSLKKLSFQASTQGLSTNTFDGLTNNRTALKRVNNGTIENTEIADTNLSDTDLTILFDDEVIPANQSRTYALFLSTSESSGNTDDDGIVIAPLSDPYSAPDTVSSQLSHNLVWSDNADWNHSENTPDWHAGYLIDLPVPLVINNSECGANKALITDPAIQNAIVSSLGAANWSGVSDFDLDNVNILNASNSGVTNLNGVDRLCNLTQLIAFDNALTGTIPSGIGNLEDLIVLRLSNNNLSGIIPDFSGATSLQQLYLNNNQFSGTIPSSLGSVSTLTHLHLQDNQFTGTIPETIGAPTNFSQINVSHNNLTGSLPESLGTHTSLALLEVQGNDLSGSIPSSYHQAPSNLTIFKAYDNQFTGDLGAFDALPTLSTFEVCQTNGENNAFNSAPHTLPERYTSLETSCIDLDLDKVLLNRSDTFTNDTFIAGIDDLSILKFKAQNNYSQVVTMKSLTLKALTDAESSVIADFDIALFADGTQQGNETSINAMTQEAIIDNLDVPLLAHNEKEFTVVLDTETTVGDTYFRLAVKDVVIQKTSDSQNAVVEENDHVLGSSVSEHNTINGVALGADCESSSVGNPATNYLCGIRTDFIASGSLTASVESVINPTTLIPGSNNVDIFKIRFSALDDAIKVKDIYLENFPGNPGSLDTSLDERLSFKLYNSSGQFLQMRNLEGGQLHFVLPNFDRILIPKGESDYVTIKVDVSSPEVLESDKFLKLRLQAHPATPNGSGIEAITTATGAELQGTYIVGGESVASQEFTVSGLINQATEVCNADKSFITDPNFQQAIATNLNFEDWSEVSNADLDTLNILQGEAHQIDSINGIGQLCNLQLLDLNDNNLFGAFPTEILSLNNLSLLDLRDNSLSGSLPEQLYDLEHLSVLKIDNNDFTGPISADIADLTKLRIFQAMDNEFSGTIPVVFGSLSHLTHLHLNGNNFSGSIPPQLGDLSQLSALSLGSNQLTGTVPNTLLNLTLLGNLSLRDNDLSGTIPVGIGLFEELYNFDLSGNNFTGSIPTDLTDLLELENFDVSDNQLTGEVPDLNIIPTLVSAAVCSGNLEDNHFSRMAQIMKEAFPGINSTCVDRVGEDPLPGPESTPEPQDLTPSEKYDSGFRRSTTDSLGGVSFHRYAGMAREDYQAIARIRSTGRENFEEVYQRSIDVAQNSTKGYEGQARYYKTKSGKEKFAGYTNGRRDWSILMEDYITPYQKTLRGTQSRSINPLLSRNKKEKSDRKLRTMGKQEIVSSSKIAKEDEISAEEVYYSSALQQITYRQLIKGIGDAYQMDDDYPEAIVYAVRMIQYGITTPDILQKLDEPVDPVTGKSLWNRTRNSFGAY